MRRLIAYALTAVVVLAAAATALAATRHGITPLAPKPNATVDKGERPLFRMRVRGRGEVWVYVCDSRKRNEKGLICHETEIGQAKKVRGIYQFRPRRYKYAKHWLNEGGTFYWQAHRVDCRPGREDCIHEGPVVKFRVR